MSKVIYIEQKSYSRLFAYPKIKPDWSKGYVEMGGFARYNREKNLIYDLFLIKSEVTSASTDTSELNLSDAFSGKKNLKNICVRWHSHANMNAFFSQTDENEDIAVLGQSMRYLISIVVNAKGDYECRVDVFDPFHITVKGIKLVPHIPMLSSQYSELVDEVQKKVVEKKIVTPFIVQKGKNGHSTYLHPQLVHNQGEIFPHPKQYTENLGMTLEDIQNWTGMDFLTHDQQIEALHLYNTTQLSWNEILDMYTKPM